MLKDKYEEKEQYTRYLVPTTNDILHFAAPNVQWVERTCLSDTPSPWLVRFLGLAKIRMN